MPRTPSPKEPSDQADDSQADASRDEDVELEQPLPSTTGALYEGSVVVEESKRYEVS